MKMGEVVVGAAGAGTGTHGDDDQQYPATSISGRQQKKKRLFK